MIQNFLSSWGVPSTYVPLLAITIKLIVLIVLCIVSNIIAKRIIVEFIKRFAAKTDNKWDDILVQKDVFHNLSHFVPAMLIYFIAPTWFATSETVDTAIHRLANTYMIIVACLVINAILDALLTIYKRYEVSRRKPIKSYIQVIKIIVYFFTGLFVVATLMDRSPWGFLSIFGGLTAVLMLVFKDALLGLVAGVQLSANNMVAVGDWIEMPNYGADGDVIDVTLTTVMVQNWDKTITTIPTYALITDSFKNWKGMSESGGRRIKRSLNIDMNSIRFLDDAMLQKLMTFDYLKEYLEQKVKDVQTHNDTNNVRPEDVLSGRRLTNVGTFRAYMISYLKHHPMIHDKMTFLVRHLAPNANGLPIEIYVFSKDQNWVNYEGIQADIFDHMLAVIGEFDLRVFQNPSGADWQHLARSSSHE